MEVLPHVPLIIYTGLSLFTRLYRIGLADSVVWDEVSCGGPIRVYASE
jgi:dolichyl-phosphate-mannose--protein O-mannosyl transferase